MRSRNADGADAQEPLVKNQYCCYASPMKSSQLILIVSATLQLACPPPGDPPDPGDPPREPTTAPLTVSVGFSSTTGTLCRGSETVTITGPGGAKPPKTIDYDGKIPTPETPGGGAFCVAAVTFEGLTPGTWRVVGQTFACDTQVKLNRFNTLTVRNRAC